MDVRAFIGGFIDAHEGGLSLDPKDNGNWYSAASYRAGKRQQRGVGTLIGSNFGITGATLADYLKAPDAPNAKRIAAVSREDAITIGVELYYLRHNLDQLPWNRVTAAVLDVMWMSGQVTGIKVLQRMIGAVADGKISRGGETVQLYAAYLTRRGEAGAAEDFEKRREALYQAIATNEGPNDPDKRFLNGWLNRARSFLPKMAWWKRWG